MWRRLFYCSMKHELIENRSSELKSNSRMILFCLALTFAASNLDFFSNSASAGPPKLYESRNFKLFTDLSKEESQELLDRLETMLGLVSKYWGRPLRKPIRMFVVESLRNWPDEELNKMHPAGLQSIQTGGGLTQTRVQSIVGGPKVDSQAIVYAVAEHQTPQHEAIHAYCGLTFGATGPVWYSEGMAEVGKYWVEDEEGVNASDYVIAYLKSRPPKPLMEIVNNPLERTGDSWQNYAWRWALCHLLGFNENYTKRFKPLGLALLAERNVTFATVYGPQAREIEFEYLQFIENLSQGYRCDLCSWDWRTRFRKPSVRSATVSKIKAQRGWQASRALVEAGATYSIETKGEWSMSQDGKLIDANGEDDGTGKLIGIIFDDYELSEEFEIGTNPTFEPPASGNLFLRSRDDWGSLADNAGVIEVRIQKKRDDK